MDYVALNMPDESTHLTFRTYLNNSYQDPISALAQNAQHQTTPGLELV